jgi:hypothetical protein
MPSSIGRMPMPRRLMKSLLPETPIARTTAGPPAAPSRTISRRLCSQVRPAL